MYTRDEKVTQMQKELLINFMEANLAFARGKLLSIEGRLEANNMWLMLSQQLNSIGPEKTIQKWQRVWTQLKTKIKRKASARSASRGRTGGGSRTETPLTDLEEKVIFVISKEGVYGLENPDGISLESDVPCTDINAPSTSTSHPASWVSITEGTEMTSNSESWMSSDASMTGEPSEEEGPTPLRTPKTPTKRRKVSEAIDSLMEQSDSTNKEISNLTNEVKDLKNVLSEILQEHRNTNSFLERIACALENKK